MRGISYFVHSIAMNPDHNVTLYFNQRAYIESGEYIYIYIYRNIESPMLEHLVYPI